MRYFRIPKFTGIEAHRSDADRGTLRLCEGAVPSPVGSLRSGPIWTALGGTALTVVADRVTCMTDAKSNGYQFIGATISGGVCPTGVHINTNQNEIPPELGALSADVAATTIGGSVPFISDVGNNTVFVGTGSGVKKVTFASGSHTVAALAASSGYYKMENEVFPNCTTFVVGMNKAVFAAGDTLNPLRVYVSEPATGEDPIREAVYSADFLSKIDILCTNASKITALSTYQSYIVVHTDAGVVLLYQTQPATQSIPGFRAEQVAGAANSGAINPNVVSGSAMIQPYYLGCDGQIWKDESARKGPDHKPTYSDTDQVSWKAKGAWNKLVAADISTSFSAYEPSTGFYTVGLPTQEASATNAKFATYLWHDMSDSLSGPFLLPKLSCLTHVPDSSKMVAVDQDSNVLTTDFEDLRDGSEFSSVIAPSSWDTLVNPGGTDEVIVDKANFIFNYYGRTLASKMAEPAVGTTELGVCSNTSYTTQSTCEGAGGTWTAGTPTYYKDAYLSIIETAYEDFGNQSGVKQWHEVVLSFRRNSWGNLWVFAQAEDGTISGQYKGSIYGKQKIKTFINLRGRRMKFRVILATHKDHPWMITEAAVGYLQGKVYT